MKINWLNFVLFAVALTLLALLAPVGVAATLLACITNRDAIRPMVYFSQTCGSMAWAIDILGNVLCKDFFDAILIKPTGYRFGEVGETISSVLGKNERDGTLTRAGAWLVAVLDWLDPDHCRNAIEPQFG